MSKLLIAICRYKLTITFDINVILLTFILALFSCNKLKRKGHEAIGKTKATIVKTKQRVVDKKDQLFPIYDNTKPDTENNKKRFKEHLQVELTNDVRNIYTYGDFLGADYKILISFTCDTTTINKIITTKAMKISMKENDEGLIFSDEFPWWKKDKIAKIKPYKFGVENEYWQYLWYDKKTNTAYYEAFSI